MVHHQCGEIFTSEASLILRPSLQDVQHGLDRAGPGMLRSYPIWLVAWNMTFIFPYSWEMLGMSPSQLTNSYFSAGFSQPPTSNICIGNLLKMQNNKNIQGATIKSFHTCPKHMMDTVSGSFNSLLLNMTIESS